MKNGKMENNMQHIFSCCLWWATKRKRKTKNQKIEGLRVWHRVASCCTDRKIKCGNFGVRNSMGNAQKGGKGVGDGRGGTTKWG